MSSISSDMQLYGIKLQHTHFRYHTGNRVLVTLSNLLLPNVITFSASMYSHATNTSNAAMYETKTRTLITSGLQLEHLICRTAYEYNVGTPYGPCTPSEVGLCAPEKLFSVRLKTF